MKKNLIFVLMCLCFSVGIPTGISAQEVGGYLYVYTPDGKGTPFAIDSIRKITFTDEAMNVFQVNGNLVQMPYSDIDKLTFESKLVSGYKVVEATPYIKVYVTDRTLFIESQEELTAVSLYNMQGVLLQSITSRSLSACLPLQNIPAGIYIVQILSRSGVSVYKFINH